MEQQLKGIQGNLQASEGQFASVFIPMYLLKKIEAAIEESDLVAETVVMQKFHLTKKTMSNYRHSKLRGCFTTAFNGARFYFMSKLLGLKNTAQRKVTNRKKVA